jgi:uncharacterized protein (DUF2236 family)
MATAAVPTVFGVLRGFPRPVPGRPGDPGLFGPGSMVWRVNGETALLLGSGRALLMQVAHPMVAAGVADHSDFQAGAFDRLWHTLDAVLTVAFGDTEQALAAADRVTGIHRRVTGSRGGRSYSALDADLLLWVHATLVDTALVTYRRFVGPLSPGDRERYYEEMKGFAVAFGVPAETLPPDLAAFRRYLQATVASLKVTPEACRLADGILAPHAPLALIPARGLLRASTVGLLPGPLRGAYGLAWGPARDRALGFAGLALRRTIPALPSKVRLWPHARDAMARSEPKSGW